MRTQKIVLRTVYCMAGLLFLVSVGYNVYQYQQYRNFLNRTDSKKIAQNKAANESPGNSGFNSTNEIQNPEKRSAAAKGIEENSNKSEASELEYHLSAAKEELDMTNEQLNDELDKKADFKEAWNRQSSGRSDPVYKKNIRDSATKLTNKNYDPLLKKLNISEDAFNELKEILIEKDLEMNELSEYYSNAPDDIEREEILQLEKDITEKYNDEIHTFLGEENNEIYQSYENRLYERRNLDDFMVGLAPENRINNEQAERLIDSMYEVRKAIYDEVEADNNESASTGLTEEKIAKSIEAMSRVHQKYVEAGSGIMTPDQLDKYITYLDQKLEMQKASMKMSLYLYEKK